jgi:hypothetical protein
MIRDGRLFLGAAAIAIAVLLAFLWRDRTAASSAEADLPQGSRLTRVGGANISPAAAAPGDNCATTAEPAAPGEVPDEIIDRDTFGIRERLVQSQDPEHLAAAALFADSAADQVEDITKALAAGPGNALLLGIAVRICDEAIDAVDCPIEKWEDEWLRVDGQNRYAWVRVAANRMRRGEPQAALNAMQHAASAAETHAYWPATLEMLDRARAAADDYQLSDRAARDIATANIPDYEAYAQMCRAQSLASAAWADACFRYGQQAELQDKTALGRAAARAVQAASLGVNGDEAVIKEADAVMRDMLQAEVDRLLQRSGSTECKPSYQGS